MAQCGGITTEELNKLELEMCEQLQWQMMITPEELSSFAREEFSPTRSDNRWRWVLAGGDEALAAALGVPSTSPPPADPGE